MPDKRVDSVFQGEIPERTQKRADAEDPADRVFRMVRGNKGTDRRKREEHQRAEDVAQEAEGSFTN